MKGRVGVEGRGVQVVGRNHSLSPPEPSPTSLREVRNSNKTPGVPARRVMGGTVISKTGGESIPPQVNRLRSLRAG